MVGLAIAPFLVQAGDVFSDAKSWHSGFVDANGDGMLNVGAGKMEFPESLLMADAKNAAHTLSFGAKNYTKEVDGVHTGVVIRTERVDYPLVNASREEVVGYFPQDVADNKYWTAGLHLDYGSEPFTVSMNEACTFFLRFKWSGEFLTPSNNPCYFLHAGDSSNYGFQIALKNGGKYGVYSAGFSSTFPSDCWDGLTVVSNKWTDFAVTVSNRTMTIYSCQAGDAEIFSASATANAATRLGKATGTVVLGNGMEGASGWPWSAASESSRLQSFRGSIQTFASWNRALSADEVRQVFTWPGTDLVRLGTANNSVQEFEGGAAPLTFAFDVAAKDAGLAQVLRVTATSTSAAGAFNVAVNGTTAGSLSVTPGKTGFFLLKKGLTVSGANTVTLTRTSAEAVAIDAIALGGGLRIGLADDAWAEFAPESYGGKVFADVKTLHRGAIPWHGNNWALRSDVGLGSTPDFPESLNGDKTSLAHACAFNSPKESDYSFGISGVSGTHTGIVVRTESVVYPYAKRTESTKALYFPQDSEALGDGKYKFWAAGLHLNTNSVPFVPKFDAANDSCTFFVRFRWDGTMPIPGQPSFFLGAGDSTAMTYGFSLGIQEGGRYYFYSWRPSLNKIWNGAADVTLAPNKWTDCAITLSNRKVTIYSYQEGSSSVAVLTASASGASPSSYAAVNSFVVGHSRSGQVGGIWDGGQSRAYGFRGSIHSFAAWDRALSADEVRQVFAWPGERTLANLGVPNGSSAEFGGTSTDSYSGFTAGTVSGAVDWFNMRGRFSETMNRLGISGVAIANRVFNLDLRFTTTADSTAADFDVYANSKKAGSLVSAPGGTVHFRIDKSLLKVGANSFELRCMSSPASVRTDALSIVPSDTCAYSATDRDFSDCPFGRYEIENGVETRQPTSVHVDIPAEIAEGNGFYLLATIRFKGDAQTLSLSVNGAADPVATFVAAASDDFREFKAKVPASALRAGDNVFTLTSSATGGKTAYLGVDFVRLETLPQYGMMLLVR